MWRFVASAYSLSDWNFIWRPVKRTNTREVKSDEQITEEKKNWCNSIIGKLQYCAYCHPQIFVSCWVKQKATQLKFRNARNATEILMSCGGFKSNISTGCVVFVISNFLHYLHLMTCLNLDRVEETEVIVNICTKHSEFLPQQTYGQSHNRE